MWIYKFVFSKKRLLFLQSYTKLFRDYFVYLKFPLKYTASNIRVVSVPFRLGCVVQESCSLRYMLQIKYEFYIHGSVHRDSVLIRSNKMQQYAGIYLLQVYSTCSGRPSRPSSGAQKTVTAASGTGHIT